MDLFIESKQLENVTQLTIKQLLQRCADFLAFLKTEIPSNIMAMNYRDAQLRRNLSHKTLKAYIAANKQFFNWCVARELITINPFLVVKLPAKAKNSPQDQRQRWKMTDLKRLFTSDADCKQSAQFH